MPSTCKVPPEVLPSLACPVCKSRAVVGEEAVTCSNAGCGKSFPMVHGVPVLINEGASVFTVEEIARQGRDAAGRPAGGGRGR